MSKTTRLWSYLGKSDSSFTTTASSGIVIAPSCQDATDCALDHMRTEFPEDKNPRISVNDITQLACAFVAEHRNEVMRESLLEMRQAATTNELRAMDALLMQILDDAVVPRALSDLCERVLALHKRDLSMSPEDRAACLKNSGSSNE